MNENEKEELKNLWDEFYKLNGEISSTLVSVQTT